MRYYTTHTASGATTFKCVYCPHSVTTLDFDSAKGNCRTQAAAALNQHARSTHARLSPPIKSPDHRNY